MIADHPSNGVRVCFRRRAGSVYDVQSFTASLKFEGVFSSVQSGYELRWEAEPPAWVQTIAANIAKTLHKNHNETGDWPRDLVRWRPEPATKFTDAQ